VKARHDEGVTQCMNEMSVSQIREKALADEEVQGLSDTFKALGDPTRVRILHALLLEELCVCDLVEVLGMTQSAISHQLSTLRKLRLVKHRKEGKMVRYSLDDDHIITLFAQGLAHIRHTFGQDQKRRQ